MMAFEVLSSWLNAEGEAEAEADADAEAEAQDEVSLNEMKDAGEGKGERGVAIHPFWPTESRQQPTDVA